MKKNYNNENSLELVCAIKRVGIQETKQLIINFLDQGEISLSDDKGLILAMFIGYYNMSEQINNHAIVNQFINFAFYKGQRIDEKKG